MFKYYLIVGTLSVFVIILLGVAIVDSGGPMATAGLKNDQKRNDDFNNISYEIDSYVAKNGKLPASLSALTLRKTSMKLTDPDTGKAYDYKVISDFSYELCTNFYADQKNLDDYSDGSYSDSGYSTEGETYKKGYSCLTYEVDSYSFDEYDMKLDRESAKSDFSDESESSSSGDLNN